MSQSNVTIEDLKRAVENLTPPTGFSVVLEQVAYIKVKGDEVSLPTLCSTLVPLAITRDIEDERWGVHLGLMDPDNNVHDLVVLRQDLSKYPKDVIARLIDAGLNYAPSRANDERLIKYLIESKTPNRARTTRTTGWFGDNAFVLPGQKTIGSYPEPILLESYSKQDKSYRQSGTLDEWQQEVARYCEGNRYLTLALCLAFTGPLLQPCNEENRGVLISGPSSSGKTTGIMMAASVYGPGQRGGFYNSFRSTDNALESVCQSRNDTITLLDEMSEADPATIHKSIYMMANGTGKARSNVHDTLRPIREWRTVCLCTGEKTVRQFLEGGRQKITAGQEVRMIDIKIASDSPFGAFQELHGFDDGGALARHIRSATSSFYGTAGPAFVEAFLKDRGKNTSDALVFRDAFVDRNCPINADGQVRRAAGLLGLGAFSGEFSRTNNVVPWRENAALEAMEACFHEWLDARGTSGSIEDERGVEQVCETMHRFANSRFEEISGNPPFDRPIDRIGFKQTHDGVAEFFVPSQPFKDIICAGYDHVAIAHALAERDMLILNTNGGISKTKYIPSIGKTIRVIHLTPMVVDHMTLKEFESQNQNPLESSAKTSTSASIPVRRPVRRALRSVSDGLTRLTA